MVLSIYCSYPKIAQKESTKIYKHNKFKLLTLKQLNFFKSFKRRQEYNNYKKSNVKNNDAFINFDKKYEFNINKK